MKFFASTIAAVCGVLPNMAFAFVISFDQDDFATTPAFSTVQTFSFTIDIAAPLAPGVFSNPTLNSINYSVFGTLVAGTPSGFTAFNLVRTIVGSEFYNQGSSLRFEIATSADLTDGVQISDLAVLADFALPSLADPDPQLFVVTESTNPVFVFNGREINNITGFSRFHPTLLVLGSDGTGSMRNSNNIVNLNLFDQIPFVSEYVTNLTLDLNTTISSDTSAVPVPAAIWLFGSALGIAGIGFTSKKAA